MDDNVKNMIAVQKKLHNKMDEIAKKNNLSSDKLSPIYDGVTDVSAYLQSKNKIMWILKEPYDYFNEETLEPEGGGWVIMDGIPDPKENLLVQTLPRTLQRIIYATRGISTGEKYDDMAYYYEPDMYKYLFQIAYINLSKMPAGTRSGDMTNKYHIWKELILEQIKLYNPDVIIFGNTFKYMSEDFHAKKMETISSAQEWLNIYKEGNQLLVEAYHPGVICSTRQYVTTLVDAILDKINH